MMFRFSEKNRQRYKKKMCISGQGIEITAVSRSSQRFGALFDFVKSDYHFLREAFKD